MKSPVVSDQTLTSLVKGQVPLPMLPVTVEYWLLVEVDPSASIVKVSLEGLWLADSELVKHWW